MSTSWSQADVGKMVSRLLIGMAVGAASAALFLGLGKRYLPLEDGAGMLAAVTGLVYVVIALSLAVGLAVPKAGARFLNVEDADELREQRSLLAYSSASMGLSGLFLVSLAVADRLIELGITPYAIALFSGLCLLGAVIIGIRSAGLYDELMRKISAEAAILTLYAMILIFGGWAALAHLKLLEWMNPLALLSGLAVIQLLTAFWVAGRRGMLKPR